MLKQRSSHIYQRGVNSTRTAVLHRVQLSCRCSAVQSGTASCDAVVRQLKSIIASGELKDSKLDAKKFVSDGIDRVGLVASREIKQDEVIVIIPETSAITSVDAEGHELIGDIAKESSELVGITLWLMAERAKGSTSKYSELLITLPESSMTPLLWSNEERATLLAGSPILPEARARAATLAEQWNTLNENWFTKDTARFSSSVFNQENFNRSFSVVLSCATYLPAAECFALLPVASLIGRTGNENGCNLDYDADKQAVVVTAGRPYREGQEVLLNDGRPNGELLLATGNLQDNNMSDYLLFPATLISTDKYFMMKSQILQSFGFEATEQFPVFADRMPNQLFAYLRLARVQDPGLIAKVSFEQDIVLSQMNEYEILQILMGDARERLNAYTTSMEEDIKELQQPDLSPKQRLAARLTLAEKKILSTSVDAVRRRLAPIRGIPTKTGSMQDPNSDIQEIFDFFEGIPTAPKRLVDGFLGWASGKDDPDWKKNGRR